MKSKSGEPEKPIHKLSFESLIAWGCLCGGRWMNEHLKDKSDAELTLERDSSYLFHQREMEKGGF